jgi:hypothetical protein
MLLAYNRRHISELSEPLLDLPDNFTCYLCRSLQVPWKYPFFSFSLAFTCFATTVQYVDQASIETGQITLKEPISIMAVPCLRNRVAGICMPTDPTVIGTISLFRR